MRTQIMEKTDGVSDHEIVSHTRLAGGAEGSAQT